MASNPAKNKIIKAAQELTAQGTKPTMAQLSAATRYAEPVIRKHLGIEVGVYVNLDAPKAIPPQTQEAGPAQTQVEQTQKPTNQEQPPAAAPTSAKPATPAKLPRESAIPSLGGAPAFPGFPGGMVGGVHGIPFSPPMPGAPLPPPILNNPASRILVPEGNGSGYVPLGDRHDWSNVIVWGEQQQVGAEGLTLKEIWKPPTWHIGWCINPTVQPQHPDWHMYIEELGYIPVPIGDATRNLEEAKKQGKICLRTWTPVSVGGHMVVGVHPYILMFLPADIQAKRYAKLVETVKGLTAQAVQQAAENAAMDKANVHKVSPEQLLSPTAEFRGESVPTGTATAQGLSSDPESPV